MGSHNDSFVTYKLFQKYPPQQKDVLLKIIGDLIQVSGHVTSQSRVAPKYLKRRQLLGPVQMAGVVPSSEAMG